MSLWSQLLAVFKEIPGVIGDRLDHFIGGAHRPRPDGTCGAHWLTTRWPCRDFLEAAERSARRRS